MGKFLVASILYVLSLSLMASEITYKPEVINAQAKNGEIRVKVIHGGGCEDHNYTLKISPYCLETYPVQCSAEIYDTTEDLCEGIISATAVFKMKDLGLNDSYYDGATITIYGAKTIKDGKDLQSSAEVMIPMPLF